MRGKHINLDEYATDSSETTLRRLFYNDKILRFVWLIINNYEPITLPQITKEFNKMFGTAHTKSFVYQKLSRIEQFELFHKIPISQCTPNGNKIEVDIIKKHKEWVDSYNHYIVGADKCTYYYITPEGHKWVKEAHEMNKREREMIKKGEIR